MKFLALIAFLNIFSTLTTYATENEDQETEYRPSKSSPLVVFNPVPESYSITDRESFSYSTCTGAIDPEDWPKVIKSLENIPQTIDGVPVRLAYRTVEDGKLQGFRDVRPSDVFKNVIKYDPANSSELVRGTVGKTDYALYVKNENTKEANSPNGYQLQGMTTVQGIKGQGFGTPDDMGHLIFLETQNQNQEKRYVLFGVALGTLYFKDLLTNKTWSSRPPIGIFCKVREIFRKRLVLE